MLVCQNSTAINRRDSDRRRNASLSFLSGLIADLTREEALVLIVQLLIMVVHHSSCLHRNFISDWLIGL